VFADFSNFKREMATLALTENPGGFCLPTEKRPGRWWDGPVIGIGIFGVGNTPFGAFWKPTGF
jgi:hypothetical protein